jgi:PBP1b-binding outer membrane lipoprotein LpoB
MKTTSGIVLLIVAAAMLLSNCSDAVADLKNWHDASTPQFVAVVLRQLGAVVLAAAGGTMMPQPGSNP